jgi:integrase
MKILKRNGIYYVAHGKKKISLFTDDESVAKQIFVGLVESITLQKLNLAVPAMGNTVVVSSADGGVVPRKKKKQIPIEPAFADYYRLCEIRKVCKNSLDFKRLMHKRIKSVGIKYFSDVDQEHINKLCEAVSKYAPDTQRKYFTELMAFLHASVKKGLISEKQVKRIEVPKLKSRVRDLIISDEDLEKIMNYTKNHDRDFYFYLLTLYNTYSRPNEITTLKGSDFHLAERYVDVWQNKVQKKKQVFLYKEFCVEIAGWIALKGDGNLFKGAKSGREHYSHLLKDIKTKLGLNPQYTLYTFRHTSITNLMNKTNDVEFVARQAGHNNPAITMKHYINRNSKHYIDLIDKMEDQNE